MKKRKKEDTFEGDFIQVGSRAQKKKVKESKKCLQKQKKS